jgi:hypothetical protein
MSSIDSRQLSYNGVHLATLVEIVRKYLSWIATALAVSCCAAWYLRTNILGTIPYLKNESDFSVFYHVAQALLSRQTPYGNSAFFYPPLLAFLVSPFALTGYLTGRWIWFFLSHGCMLLAAWICWRALGGGRIALCCIACVWAFGGSLRETLQIGQLAPVLVVALACAYSQREKEQQAAVAFGFVLKYFPGVLAAALFLRDRRRTLVSMAVAAVCGIIIPWAVLLLLFRGAKAPVNGDFWMGTPDLFSWSIPSMVLRVLDPIRDGVLPHNWQFGHNPATLWIAPALRWTSAVSALLTLGVGILALAVVCRGKLTGEQAPWAMAGLLSLSLAAAPVCWNHYQVLQYPAIAMLLAAAIRLRAWRMSAGVILCAALLYPLPQAVLLAYHDRYGVWTAASPVTLYLCTAAAPLACLAIFALALGRVSAARPASLAPRRAARGLLWWLDSRLPDVA